MFRKEKELLDTLLLDDVKFYQDEAQIKQKGPVGIGKATATVDGKLAATAELTFMIG